MAEAPETQVVVSTAPDSGAREAVPTSQPTTPPTTPEPAAAPAAFDADALLAQLKDAPDDVYDRLVQLDPLRRRVSAESSRAIQRARDDYERERTQRETMQAQQQAQQELERAFDLALSDDLDIDPTERDAATKRVREHRQYQQTQQMVLKDPSVQEWAVRQAGVQIALQVQQHPELAKYWDAAAAGEAPDYADLVLRLARAYADDRVKELDPAIRADERTKRLQGLPNPDLTRSQGLPEARGGLTTERYQQYLRTRDPALKPTSAEIDALTASYGAAT